MLTKDEVDYIYELINEDTEHNKLYTTNEWNWRRKLMTKIQDLGQKKKEQI